MPLSRSTTVHSLDALHQLGDHAAAACQEQHGGGLAALLAHLNGSLHHLQQANPSRHQHCHQAVDAAG